MAAAGTWVTLYWSGLTAGRIVFGLVANRWPLDALVRGALVAIAAAAALIATNPFPTASGSDSRCSGSHAARSSRR